MCYRSINIYNPVRTFNFDQPIRTSVPCLQCADCQRIMQNEWFFRSFIEFKYYRSIHGACYFVTLTYNDQSLPYFTLPDGTKQSCFNRLHVRNFIKYIRVWLKRHHYMSEGIKYIICSEYGTQKKRPHYHGLLYFPFHLDSLSFTRLMKTCWKHGFVICSDEGWEIKSVAGIAYASKYVSKDFTFYNLPAMRDLLQYGDFKTFCKEHKDFLPRHWQSVGFGSQFIDVINAQQDIAKFLADNKYNLWNDSNGSFPIPRYYHLKLEKRINKEYSKLLDKVVLERTEIGTKVREIRLNRSIDRDVAKLRTLSSFSMSFDLLDHNVIKSYFVFLKEHRQHMINRLENIFFRVVESWEKYKYYRDWLMDYIPNELQRLDIRRFSAYRIFLRFMPICEDEDPSHKFAEVDDIIHNILYPSVYPPEFEDVIVPSGLSEFGSPVTDDLNIKRTTVCRDLPYFADYEKLSQALDNYSLLSGISKEFNTLYKQYINKKCKHYRGKKPHIFNSEI